MKVSFKIFEKALFVLEISLLEIFVRRNALGKKLVTDNVIRKLWFFIQESLQIVTFNILTYAEIN